MTPAERAAHQIAADAILKVIADRGSWRVPEQFLDAVFDALQAIWLEHEDAATSVDVEGDW